MRGSNSALDFIRKLTVLRLGVLVLVGASASYAQSRDTESYTWSAELVSFDEATNTITVRSRLVETPKVDLTDLRGGDRAMLTWSGISTAAGVRAIERGTNSSFDRMTLPIEFVASELEGRYVSFKVPVPAADAAAIERLNAGTWVTATSRHQPRDWTEAVTSIRPYYNVN